MIYLLDIHPIRGDGFATKAFRSLEGAKSFVEKENGYPMVWEEDNPVFDHNGIVATKTETHKYVITMTELND